MKRGIFIVGTDTGVGKTLAACAILHLCEKQGLRAVGMKPVAAGFSPDEKISEDARLLMKASNIRADLRDVNPISLASPIAPHIAAVRENAKMEWAAIESAYRRLAAAADFVVVEGVGGLKTPLRFNSDADDFDASQMAKRFGLPIALVVGIRLGCLNHAILTAESIAACGLHLAGWIGVRVDSRMEAAEENIASLSRLIPAPNWGIIPYLSPPIFSAAADFLSPDWA